MQNGAVNYYDLLQIHPRAERETIERVYKLLAARYHPDNPVTGDAERFRWIKEAYDTLRDPERRAAYDCHFTEGGARPLDRTEAISYKPTAKKRGAWTLNLRIGPPHQISLRPR